MRVGVVGPGAVGGRVARQLRGPVGPPDAEVVLLHPDPARLAFAAGDAGGSVTTAVAVGPADLPTGLDVVVLACPGPQRRWAAAAMESGAHVVSTADDPAVATDLLALDAEAAARGRHVVVGAAMSPGLSCTLALLAARDLDRVVELHVCTVGTGGPACARRHHRALTSPALDWVDGAWVRRPGGSGRELVWFPEPVGGADCYRAGLVDPVLLVPAFPGVRRVTARMEATRRDRLTSPLPMLRPPHPEGLLGAVRVEARGFAGPEATTTVYGAAGPPAQVAAAVAATAAAWAAGGRLARPGAAGLAELVGDLGGWLRELHARGVPASRFEGADAASGSPGVPAPSGGPGTAG